MENFYIYVEDLTPSVFLLKESKTQEKDLAFKNKENLFTEKQKIISDSENNEVFLLGRDGMHNSVSFLIEDDSFTLKITGNEPQDVYNMFFGVNPSDKMIILEDWDLGSISNKFKKAWFKSINLSELPTSGLKLNPGDLYREGNDLKIYTR